MGGGRNKKVSSVHIWLVPKTLHACAANVKVMVDRSIKLEYVLYVVTGINIRLMLTHYRHKHIRLKHVRLAPKITQGGTVHRNIYI